MLITLGRWRRTLQQEDLPRACQYMIFPDHFDMVGVQLSAIRTQLENRKIHASHHMHLVD